MRRLTSLALAAAAIAGAAAHVGALEPVKAGQAGRTTEAQARGGSQGVPGQIRTEVLLLRLLHLDDHVPPADSFIIGGRIVAAGETVPGVVAVARGPLEVRGRIDGNALALHGDIILHPGGLIRGDAVAIGGRVRAQGGVVEGTI
jgi:hypothetical protein